MHVELVKQIVDSFQRSGLTNKEEQACLLGYILGIETPINVNFDNGTDAIEWNSFFNDIPGQFNEHYMINLTLAQDVAKLTVLYRQAVMNGSDEIPALAKQFLTLTGHGFGLLGADGLVVQIRKLLKGEIEERVSTMEERRQAVNNDVNEE